LIVVVVGNLSDRIVRSSKAMAESLDSYRARLDGAAIATYVMVMLIVPLKIWCRKKTGGLARLGLDDALSVVTLVFANVFFYITMIGKCPLNPPGQLIDL
jgi:hypothetical protein